MSDFWNDDDDEEGDWGEEPQWTPAALASAAKKHSTTGGDGSEDTADATTTTTNTTTPMITGAQHVILLVDCAVDGTGTSTIASSTTTALSLCQAILQGRIRDTVKYKVGKRNGVGIILFDTKALSSSKSSKSNTPKENNDNDNDNDDDDASSEDDDDNEEDDATPPLHVHVLMDLEPPGIASVQTIRQWLAQPKEFQSKFGCSKDDSTTTTSHTTTIPPLQTALEEAMLQFRSAKCVKTSSSPSGGGAQQQQQQQVDTKSIWILTHRECPISDLGAQSRLQTIARDFHEQEIEIVVWPLLAAEHENDEKETPSPPPPPLDMSLFYDSIVTQDVFEGRRLSHHTNDDLEDELEGLQSFWKKIRRLYWGPLLLPGQSEVDKTSDNENETDDNDSSSLSPNNTIMVDWYRFVQLAKRPTKVQFDQATKREVLKLKQYLDDKGEIFASLPMGNTATSSHRTTPPGLGRLRQFAHLGGQDVPLSMADLQQIRHEANLCPTKPSLRVLGFRPSHTRLHYHSMDAAYLIYPNDTLVKGSAQAFSELHSAMLRKQVVGIGEVLHRLHWSSRLVALIPLPTSSSTPGASVQDEKDEKENERLLTTPPGMMVVTLPFEDDIRTLEEDEAYTEWMRRQVGEAPNDNVKPEIEPSNAMISPLSIQLASEDLLQATTRLIQRHGLVDTCLGEDFENAALTEFFTYLEEVALELPHDETESPTFDTRPNEELLAEALGDCIDKFRQALPEDIEIPKTKSGGGTKRKAAKDLPPDDSGMDWQDLYESDELNTVKVPHLKAYLRSVGAPLSGSKAVLVDRVADLLKQSMAATFKKSGSGDPKVKLEV